MKIVIVGAGKLGMKLADALLGGDHAVTIIDTNEQLLQKISSHLDVMTINANAKEIKTLKRINVASYDFLITVTGNDEVNILIASFAKKLGCNKVIARVRDPEHMQQGQLYQGYNGNRPYCEPGSGYHSGNIQVSR